MLKILRGCFNVYKDSQAKTRYSVASFGLVASKNNYAL